MFDSVCVFNNKVFVFQPDTFLVPFQYIKLDNHDQAFKECAKLKIPLPNNFVVKNIFLDVVENYSVGLKCLILLVVNTNNEVSTFMYSETLSNHVFRLRKPIWLKKMATEPNINLFVTHGPTLIYFFESNLEIYSLLHNTKQYLELMTLFSGSSDHFKVLQVTSIGQLHHSDPITVLLLILSRKTAVGNEVCILSIGINTKQDNTTAIHKKISTSFFFPRCFQNVIKSINVTNINIAENQISNLSDIKWNGNFCCLATHEECLAFHSGSLKYVVRLPFPDVSQIKTEFCDFKSGNVRLIVMSENESVHLLTTANSLNTFDLQLIKTWTSIKSVLCGDILLNGSKHLLLLKNTSLYSWQSGCIISDISTCNPVDILHQASDSDAAMSRAIPGLFAKVQRGKLNIIEAESKISKKIEATLDALCRLKYNNNGDELVDHHVSSFQESLVDIILNSEENSRPKNVVFMRPQNLKPHNHWTRFIDNRCVFCWTFDNDDERAIFNPTLAILIQNQQIQFAQKLFIHKLDVFSIEDECNRQINQGERFSVVASSEVAEFHGKSVEVRAILSCYFGTSLEFENELYLPMEDKTLVQHQLNMETVVSASDIFRTQLEDISSPEHLACMKVVQQRTVLSIFTLHSDVTKFENILVTSAYGAAHLLSLENFNLKSLVFKRANLPLFGVHMIFNSLNTRTLEIEVFTKNDKETYILVQFLYQYFPEDVLILPCGLTLAEFDQQKQGALCAMKNEIDLLLSTFAIHNGVEMITPNNSKVLNKAGTIVIQKETFLRIRKTLVKKECVTDNIVQNLTGAKFPNVDHPPITVSGQPLTSSESVNDAKNTGPVLGDFVAVKYKGKMYPDQMISDFDSSNEACMKCLEKSGQFWKWPDAPDVLWYWYEKKQILMKICPNEFLPNGGKFQVILN